MYINTEAIVLHIAKYSDNTSILHAYTRDNGRMQYIVHISRKKNIANQLQPLSYVELESGENKAGSQFRHLKSVRLLFVPQKTDFYRLSVSIFISEVLYRILRHPMPDAELFDYLVATIRSIDAENSVANSHLQFLLNLTPYLGIMPSIDLNYDWLDMQTGLPASVLPAHKDCFSKQEMQVMNALSNFDEVCLTRTERQVLLEKLCRYYELHITDFHTPKSLDILKELFD